MGKRSPIPHEIVIIPGAQVSSCYVRCDEHGYRYHVGSVFSSNLAWRTAFTTAAAQALLGVSDQRPESLARKGPSYKYPSLRIAISAVFFRSLSWTPQNIGIGIVANMKSVATLIALHSIHRTLAWRLRKYH